MKDARRNFKSPNSRNYLIEKDDRKRLYSKYGTNNASKFFAETLSRFIFFQGQKTSHGKHRMRRKEIYT